MRHTSTKLPPIQSVTVSVICEHRSGPHRAERVALATSFPAYAAVVPIAYSHWSGDLRYNYGRLDIFFELQDLLLFGGVGLLWYWIGVKLGQLYRCLTKRALLIMGSP